MMSVWFYEVQHFVRINMKLPITFRWKIFGIIVYTMTNTGVLAQQPVPTISPFPFASVEEGGSLTFICDFSGPETITAVGINENGLNVGFIRALNTSSCETYQQLANTSVYRVECKGDNEFHVTILSVSIDRNGKEWDCEPRINGIYIRSEKSAIQVIVGITSVSLVSPSGSSVSVVVNNAQQFRCETSAGNPKAIIEWYKDNGTPNEMMDDSLITTGNTTDTSPSGTLLVTIAKLTLTTQKADNGVGVYCRANNGGSWRFSSRSVVLDVQFAPDKGPVIQGFTATTPYYMIRNSSTTQQLTCAVIGGNPPASVTWSCYGSSQTSNSIQGKNVTRTVTWTAGTKTDSSCTCTASHIVGWNRFTSVNVTVLYAPSAPQCTVGSSTVYSGKLKIIRGSSLTIVCLSDGNPPPDFKWSLPNVGTRSGPELTVNNVQTAATFALNVTNTMTPSIGQPQLGSSNTYFSTEILFPPSTPAFHYGNTTGPAIPNNRLNVVKGNYSTIACVSTANPGPSYTWEGTSQLWMFFANTNTTKECRVKNTMTPTGYGPVTNNTIARLDVTVLYPPSIPVLRYPTCNDVMTSVPAPLRVIKGQQVHVECQTNSIPPSRYTWSAYQSSLNHEFVIDAVDTQNQGTYTCAVSNQMVTTFDGTIPGMSSSSFAIYILYPPVVLPLVNMSVLEENTVIIECNVTPGNPIETTFMWTKNQTEVMSQQQLRIEKITRQQSGVYTCTASNTMRPSGCDSRTEPDHKEVYIDVQYRSEVKDLHVETFDGQTVVTIYQATQFNIVCDVDGNPKSDITLIKDGVVLTESLYETSLHYIQQTSDCERDIGVYTCTGRNKHTIEPSAKHLTLYVQCKPRPASNIYIDANVTTGIGVRATFVFKVAAYPRPTANDYTWEKLEQGSWTEVANSSKTEYFVSKDGLQFNLSITDVAENDFSSYRVNVSNTLGTITQIFRLQAQVDSRSNTAPVIGGVIGGCLGLVVAVFVLLFILRRKYALTCSCSLHKKEDVHAEQNRNSAENPGYNAAVTYEEVSATKETPVYDALNVGNDGPDNSHVYMPLDDSNPKSHAYYENIKRGDPVYNNTVLKNTVQTVL